MLGKFLHWFYCLPLHWAAVLLLVLTAVFLLLRSRFEKYTLWKILLCLPLLGWIAMVLYLTVGGRETGESEHFFTLFASYKELIRGGNVEIIRTNLMNVFLFYPGGVLAISSVPWKQRNAKVVLVILLIFLIMSLAIEGLQFLFSLGHFELDDMLHNFLGGTIGVLIGLIRLRIKFKMSFK